MDMLVKLSVIICYFKQLLFVYHIIYMIQLKLALLKYKINKEGMNIGHNIIGGRMQDAMRDLMQRNGSYYIRGYALSFWSILMFLGVLAAVRCLLQRIGACEGENTCFDGRIYWSSPGYFVDSWGRLLELVGNLGIGSFIVHGIRNYNFGLSVFGTIWILVNEFIMIWLGKRGYQTDYGEEYVDDDVRYFMLAVLCGLTFCSQILFAHKV